MLVMMLHLAQTNINRGKHGEYKCLNESYKELQTVEEDTEQYAHYRHDAVADTWHADGSQEDNAQDTQQSRVAREDVGEKSDSQ